MIFPNHQPKSLASLNGNIKQWIFAISFDLSVNICCLMSITSKGAVKWPCCGGVPSYWNKMLKDYKKRLSEITHSTAKCNNVSHQGLLEQNNPRETTSAQAIKCSVFFCPLKAGTERWYRWKKVVKVVQVHVTGCINNWYPSQVNIPFVFVVFISLEFVSIVNIIFVMKHDFIPIHCIGAVILKYDPELESLSTQRKKKNNKN